MMQHDNQDYYQSTDCSSEIWDIQENQAQNLCSFKTEKFEHVQINRKRPISDYFKSKEGKQHIFPAFYPEKMQKLQMILIQEVNSKFKRDEKTQNSGPSYLRRSLIDELEKTNQNNELTTTEQTKAQKVPRTAEKLKPSQECKKIIKDDDGIFKLQSLQSQKDNQFNINYELKDSAIFYMKSNKKITSFPSCKQYQSCKNQSIDLNEIQNQNHNIQAFENKNEMPGNNQVNKYNAKNETICQESQERQIKYLGLIIEKDEEYLVQEDDLEMLIRFKGYQQALEDQQIQLNSKVNRLYVPIRNQYITIVKNCRNKNLECHEKRGRNDFKRTAKSLFKIARKCNKLNNDQF